MDYKYTTNVIDSLKLDEILEEIDKKRKIVIYGAADCGVKTYAYLLCKGYQVCYFVDRNQWLQDERPYFTDVLSLEKFQSNYRDEIVMVASYKAGVCIEINNVIKSFVKEENIFFIPIKEHIGYLPLPEQYTTFNKGIRYEKERLEDVPITVISLVYNTPEHYLRRTIESVLSQTYRNFRYVIIDHASNDGTTSKIIRQYEEKDKRIQVVSLDVNYISEMFQGRASDLEELYEILKGEINTKYVCILDSDDCFEKHYLERAYQALNENDADAYFIGAVSYDESAYMVGNLWESFYLPPHNRCIDSIIEKIFYYANAYGSIGGWGAVTTKELFLKGYKKVYVGTNLTSDLKAGYCFAMESKRSVYGGDVCLYYVNRLGNVSQVLKKNISQRLDNIIGLCLGVRLEEMKSLLEKENINYEKVLYRYAEYYLMVLIFYLTSIKVRDLTKDCKQEITDRVNQLITDDYISKVLNSKQWHRNELDKIVKSLEGGK